MVVVENFAPGGVDLIIDIVGFFDDGTLLSTGASAGARFTPLSPTRIVDSRIPTGVGGPLTAGQTDTIDATPIGDPNTVALASNLAAISPTAATYLTFWPGGPIPIGSTLNPAVGQTVANAAITGLSSTATFNAFNFHGTTGLIADINGFYDLPPAPPTTTAP